MFKVYLMQHASEPRFKIGKAKNPLVRMKAFQEKINLESIVMFLFRERADRVERGLHKKFAAWRLPPSSYKDGATEWFDIECWDQCREALEAKYLETKQSILEGRFLGEPI
jgi:hypothetical protein